MHPATSRPNPGKQHFCRGTTLLEMLVVMLIALLLLGQGAPSLAQLLTSMRLRSAAGAFYSHLMLARSEAIKRNSRAALCASSDGFHCLPSGHWEQGWIVFHDANDNGQVDLGETIVARQAALQESLRFTGNANVAKYVSYSGDGSTKMIYGAFQAGHFTICAASASVTDAKLIYISRGGGARTASSTVEQC